MHEGPSESEMLAVRVSDPHRLVQRESQWSCLPRSSQPEPTCPAQPPLALSSSLSGSPRSLIEASTPIPMPPGQLPIGAQRCRDMCHQPPSPVDASGLRAPVGSCRPLRTARLCPRLVLGFLGVSPNCLQFACNAASSSPSRGPSSSFRQTLGKVPGLPPPACESSAHPGPGLSGSWRGAHGQPRVTHGWVAAPRRSC